VGGVLVLGAGGHAKVVADILLGQGIAVAGFLDDDPATWGQTRLGLPVLGSVDSFGLHSPEGLVPGIGSNHARQALVARLGPAAYELWRNAIHPRATVAASARLGRGVVIAAGAVVNPDTEVEDHAIINTGAVVDHDCTIGEYAHVAPGARLAGGVRVGEGALVGIGASIVPQRSVGAWAVVGAGAAVVSDIPDGVTAVGVPARWKELRNQKSEF
jgi:sugar O-acyltransferase (sialic acid O-acetyltransferase NeuD family)